MGRRIRITSVTSVSDGAGRRYGHGQVVEVEDKLAAAWIAAGHAEPHSGKPTSQDRPVRQAADGRRRATRRAPRDAGAKAAGATDAEAAAVRGNDQDNTEDGSTSSDGQ